MSRGSRRGASANDESSDASRAARVRGSLRICRSHRSGWGNGYHVLEEPGLEKVLGPRRSRRDG